MALEEYLNYDDGTDTRYELVDGVLVEMSAEHRLNEKIALWLLSQFLQLPLSKGKQGYSLLSLCSKGWSLNPRIQNGTTSKTQKNSTRS
jgi:Uma2 family endonuclease